MIPPAFAHHARLLLEPWGMRPADVAALTTQQVVELYLKPAAEMARQVETAGQGTPQQRQAHEEPTWEWFLATWGSQYRGKTLAEIRQKFEAVHAAWAKEHGGR